MNETKFFVSYSYTSELPIGGSGFGNIEITVPSDILFTYTFIKDVRDVIKRTHLEKYDKDRVIVIINIIKLEA